MPKQIKDQQWPEPMLGMRYRKVGERVWLDGQQYRIDMVNPCRARCIPVRKVRVTIKDKVWNKKRTFTANGRITNICPTTERNGHDNNGLV